MTVVFFISGHGFGHASRQVEVINAFGALVPGVRLLIRTAVSPPLLARTLRVPYELRPGLCDSGIVQRSSVEHDDESTIAEAIAFYSQFSERVDADVRFLARDDVRLIVGDIPPLAFEVAARLGVPSVAVGNFTWDWIYETHPGLQEAAPWLVPMIRDSYRRACAALQLPFGGGFDVFLKSTPVPLIARRPSRDPDATRAHFNVPLDRSAALLSFGGYGMPALDLSRVDCSDWTLVLTDRILPVRPSEALRNVICVEEQQFGNSGFRYEDLVAAVDVVVSKPGYGIVSECIACDTPLLYTSRGTFREYDMLAREMSHYLRCRFIDQKDLFAGQWRAALQGLLAQPEASEKLSTDGADVVARELARLIRSC